METRKLDLYAVPTGSRSGWKIPPYRLDSRRSRLGAALRAVSATGIVLIVGLFIIPTQADAATATVGLGTVGAYSVLGGQTVTNTGPSTLSGDLGVSPGTAITGFPPGKASGATYDGNAKAAQAQSDLVTGYNQAASEAPTGSIAGDLVGKSLTAGVYKSTGPIGLSGTLTLNGQGNPESVFIFQIASTLITASSSKVSVINGAQACNVFWQVTSSATLGTTSSFTGTIMALTSITVTTGTTVAGRALARNGAVTLDDDTFTSPSCKTITTPPTTATTTSATTTRTSTSGSGTKRLSTSTTTAIGTGTGSNGSGNGGSGTGTNANGLGSGTPPLASTGFGPGLVALLLSGAALILFGFLSLVFGLRRLVGGRGAQLVQSENID